MISDLIHDRGRGPEIVGTRITVYNLLAHFFDPTMTESRICLVNGLTPEQVAAARAYVFTHADTILAEHLRIEERIASETEPRDAESASRAKQTFVRFKEWLDRCETAERGHDEKTNGTGSGPTRLPTFREWLSEQEPRSGAAS